MVGAWVATAVVVVGAVAFASGVGRGDAGAAPPDVAAPQASSPPGAGAGAGAGAPPTGQPPAGTPGRSAPGARQYSAVALDAGQSLALEGDPSTPVPGAGNGTLGYTPDGRFFVTDAARGAMALLDPDVPGTLEACRSEDNLVVSVPRTQLTVGSRLCVLAADGTTALVTFRQLSAPGGPVAHALLDVTVWPGRQL